MSFDTPAGTRGSGQTFTGPFNRRLDKLGGTRIGRKVFRKLMGCDVNPARREAGLRAVAVTGLGR